jgi:hypothetical protein
MGLTTTKLSRVRPYLDEASLERAGGHQIDWSAVTLTDANGKKYLKAGTVMGVTAAGLMAPRGKTIAISALAVAGTTATATSAAHGLAVGDRVTISGATPAWLNAAYTVATVADENTFTVTVTPTASTGDARAVTLTIATDLVGLAAHGLIAGNMVEFEEIVTTTGLAAGTNYYVIAAGLTADAFSVSTTATGAAVNLATGDGTALVRQVAGGTYAATGTIVASRSAAGILETDAVYAGHSDSLSGYSLLVGGVLLETLLPDASGTPKVLPAAYKSELAAAGCTFKYAAYADSRAG